jgi:hypothetical protein
VPGRADEGFASYTLTAQGHERVHMRAERSDGKVIEENVDTATGIDYSKKLPAGDYAITWTAVDQYGNETTQQVTAQIKDPLTTGELVRILLIMFVVVAAALTAAAVAWRRREQIRAWRARRRFLAAERAAVARANAEQAAYQQKMTAYAAQYDQWQRDEQAWGARGEDLRELRQVAIDGSPSRPLSLASFKLRKGEAIYTVVSGELIDTRTSQGVSRLEAVDRGKVTVTDQRVIFNGAKNRDWYFAKLTWIRHDGTDTSIMQVDNRQNASGVRYDDAERTRLFIDIALAEFNGDRSRVVNQVDVLIAAHRGSRPVPPTHPGEPPAPYVARTEPPVEEPATT